MADNFRKFRREMAGRGVNLVHKLVAGATTEILVVGLKEGDEIVSALSHVGTAAPVALTLLMELKAVLNLFTVNKVFRIVPRNASPALPGTNPPQGTGVPIYIQITAGAANAETVPTVTVTPHGTAPGDGADLITIVGDTTDGSTILSTALEVVAAINKHPVAGKMVIASIPSGTGGTAVTATGPHRVGATIAGDIASGSLPGYTFSKGPIGGSLTIQASTAGVVYTARGVGAATNSIRVRYLDPGANDAVLSVTMSGFDITVNLATDSGGTITSIAADIAAAVNASEAGRWVRADPVSTGAAVVVAESITALAGGRDEGRLRFTDTDTFNAVVELQWVSRG